MKRKAVMHYDSMIDRWCAELDGDEYGLHCGESFELYVGGDPVPCRIEMDREWYVIVKDVRFNLRKSDKYTIRL
jgi:hypothetical protein